jgi:hypothetical protein
MTWGPLSMTNPTTNAGTATNTDANYGNGAALGNYAIATSSPAVDHTPSSAGAPYTLAPGNDFFGNPRKVDNAVDAGAVETKAPTTAVLAITPTSLTFSGVQGQTTASQTLTLTNSGIAAATGITVNVTAPFSRPTGNAGGTCGATLNAGANCSVNIVYSPGIGVTSSSGTAVIAANVTVTGSPVQLTGTAVAQVSSATLTPISWTPSATRGCGLFTCPTQVFTLTNTGNIPLTGITQGVLGGTNVSEFTVRRAFSSCGPAGGGQLFGQTTLAPNASCVVTVSFTPLTAQTTGSKTATISVTAGAAGAKSSTLTGTAN